MALVLTENVLAFRGWGEIENIKNLCQRNIRWASKIVILVWKRHRFCCQSKIPQGKAIFVLWKPCFLPAIAATVKEAVTLLSCLIIKVFCAQYSLQPTDCFIIKIPLNSV